MWYHSDIIWQTKLHHSIGSDQRCFFCLGSSLVHRNNKDRFAMVFAFINRTAKTANCNYINLCDTLSLKKRKIKLHTIYKWSLPIKHSRTEWSDLRFHLSWLTVTLLGCSKSSVSMFWLRLPIGKRSRWNISITPLGWEDACFSKFVHVTLPTTAAINSVLKNCSWSGNHIFEGHLLTLILTIIPF